MTANSCYLGITLEGIGIQAVLREFYRESAPNPLNLATMQKIAKTSEIGAHAGRLENKTEQDSNLSAVSWPSPEQPAHTPQCEVVWLLSASLARAVRSNEALKRPCLHSLVAAMKTSLGLRMMGQWLFCKSKDAKSITHYENNYVSGAVEQCERSRRLAACIYGYCPSNAVTTHRKCFNMVQHLFQQSVFSARFMT